MDPLTHTLVGASLAQTRFGRVRFGTATLVVGANLPDLDAATYFFDSQLSLGFRRGWTHGVLAMALLPALLGWVMGQVDRFRCRRDPTATPVSPGRFMALSYISVLSHPALDWLNTYGVRLLMPFDGRWFYGDSLFIIDPWVWLLLGTVTMLAHSGSRPQAAGWIALGVIVTILVTGFPGMPTAIRVLWCLGVATVVGLRVWGGLQQTLRPVATVCLLLVGVYLAGMIGSSQVARSQVTAWARARGIEPRRIMVGPVPADPFRREVLIVDDLHYHRIRLDWLADDLITPVNPQAVIGDDHPATAVALASPELRGFATWTRFPRFNVEATADGYHVSVADMRGLGGGVVELDHELHPIARRP
ncbi:MAG TPA: metal-dependent hydrolase [Acidobacteria bacterium]|nr:metal-dependent hydrolase [Acidobacteriota bacterium]